MKYLGTSCHSCEGTPSSGLDILPPFQRQLVENAHGPLQILMAQFMDGDPQRAADAIPPVRRVKQMQSLLVSRNCKDFVIRRVGRQQLTAWASAKHALQFGSMGFPQCPYGFPQSCGRQKTYHFAMESLRIVPVCDRHIAAKPMHPATVPFTNADKFFKCWEIGCERYYSPSQGYFFLRSERVQKGTRAMKECPSPSCTRAYLGIVRSEGAHRWWRCFDCGSMVENPAPWRSL